MISCGQIYVAALRTMNEPLKPARFDESGAEGKAFKAKVPWKWILGIAFVLAAAFGWYNWRERSNALQIRGGIAASYEAHVVPVRERVFAFREKLEAWVQEAAEQNPPETYADSRLNLAGLHRAQGLYMRIHVDHTGDSESISNATRLMDPDAISRCLGLSPSSLKGFYDRLGFLSPEWLEEVEEAGDDNLRLRVLEEQLRNRVARDLPLMLDAERSDYFLLVIQRGETRREHPVDVFLWDVQRETLLLRTRAQARGTFIPVRIAIGDTPYGKAPPPPRSTGVSDCSIASQVRAVAGEGAPGVGSEMPVAPDEPDAGVEESDAGTETETESEPEPESEPEQLSLSLSPA